MTHIAFVFPGQGSQAVGMGKALAAEFPEARAVFDAVDDALGEKLSARCFEGPDTELNLTANTQPAILTVSLAVHVPAGAVAADPGFRSRSGVDAQGRVDSARHVDARGGCRGAANAGRGHTRKRPMMREVKGRRTCADMAQVAPLGWTA